MANTKSKTHPSAAVLHDPSKTPSTGATTPEDIEDYLRSFASGPQSKPNKYVEQRPKS